MRGLLITLALTAAACGSDGASRSDEQSTPPTTARPSTTTTLLLSREEFIARRNQICTVGSGDIATINGTLDGASGQELADGFGLIAARIRTAQTALDELAAPEELQSFVAEDNDRRARRIDFVEQMQAAAVDNPDAMADIESKLTALNIETEHEEDLHGTFHCP